MEYKQKVIFVCTGNSARSQMAEGLLRHHAGDEFEVFSAGLEPKGVNPLSIKAMDEIGIDIRNHTSDSIKQYMGHHHFSHAVTVCSDADEKCPSVLWSNGVRHHWPFDDPAAAEGTEDEKLAVFRRVRNEIDTKIRAWLAELHPAEA
jgi:arsenate reductase